MVPDFFWDYVKRPLNVGSKKDKELEKVELAPGQKSLFNNLCKMDDQQNYFKEFDAREDEDGEDLASVASSTYGSDVKDGELNLDDDEEPGDVEDWRNLDNEAWNVKIGDLLKNLGNARKKCTSKDILCDMLGLDGDRAMVNVKKAREEKLKKELRKLNTIYMSVLYFDMKMKKQMENLRGA